jgi:hypothetical protein
MPPMPPLLRFFSRLTFSARATEYFQTASRHYRQRHCFHYAIRCHFWLILLLLNDISDTLAAAAADDSDYIDSRLFLELDVFAAMQPFDSDVTPARLADISRL